MESTISVIIPTYNSEKYIGRCLESIMAQSFQHIEVIVVNDGSTDKTDRVLEKYRKQYHNLVIINQKNGGVSKARNVGIDAAKSSYITFIDADDTIDKDYLETLVKTIKDYNADIALCGCKNIDSDSGNVLFTDSPLNHQIVYEEGNNLIFWGAPWGKIYKSSLIKGKCYFSVGEIFEDDPYSIMVHSLASNIATVDYYGYNYYINNPDSSMGIEAREHRFVQRFPFMAYEDTVKTVMRLGNHDSINRLKIYYLRMMMSIIYRRINPKKDKDIVRFHYRLCKENELTKQIRWKEMPIKEKYRIKLMIAVTKLHLI